MWPELSPVSQPLGLHMLPVYKSKSESKNMAYAVKIRMHEISRACIALLHNILRNVSKSERILVGGALKRFPD